MCRSARVGGIQDNSSEVFLGAVEGLAKKNNTWAVTLCLEGKPVTLTIDTGAEVTVISEETWRAIDYLPLTQAMRSLTGPDSRQIHSKGKFSRTLSLHERSARDEIYVISGLSKALLGRPAINQLNLVRQLAAVEEGKTPRSSSHLSSRVWGSWNSPIR